MIDAVVDGQKIDPTELEMHQQDQPFPGGSIYTLRVVDPELARVAGSTFPVSLQEPLTRLQTVSLFNLLRPYISQKLGRRKPAFWANTVDAIRISETTVEFSGICSPHLGS